MVNDNDTLQTGQNYYDYHKSNIEKMDGFNITKGSNFDKLVKFIDSTYFTSRQNLDEQDKAHDINYAHGLELDDKGDNYSLFRNNLDDETYRFLLKSHLFSSRSKGTFKDLLNITANLLGCKPEDVRMVNARTIKNGIDNGGDANTLTIKDIDISKVQHANLIPELVKELQHSTAGGYRVNQIGFSVAIDMPMYVGSAVSLAKYFDI
ncbi:hypothetical protein DY124_06085 [Apilactobacillus micheneri]|uniref:hypothetical protein n=1 Tax=Apilactobacillus micheneri TaxID=1899430 RepID=UPI00112D2E9F|nr:hypothetical protein [Apilactobacillus micheneri]TPR43143.1 hypothetical protein DY124_06085 [Apilactobacillus micheneri]TPR47231.1 hypothetical protein DY125_06580 [Apilactobacillus micheneri]